MALTFNYWKHPAESGADRIYVRGLKEGQHPLAGKAYLCRTRAGLALYGDFAVHSAKHLLNTVLDAAGIQPDLANAPSAWTILTAHCQPGRKPSPNAAPASEPASGLDVATIKVPSPITIRVDHREPDLIIRELRKAANTTIEVCHLDLGDYSVDDRLFIERKTIPDFQSSIIDDKRLFDQSERIKMAPDSVGVVLVEGEWGAATRMLPQQVIGALSFLGAIQGMSVWNTTDHVCTAYTIVKLATHLCNGLGYELGLRQDKPKALLDAQRYVLEGCPGVSAELARRLLHQFGSIAGVAAAPRAALLSVEGVGPKKADRILEVMQGRAG